MCCSNSSPLRDETMPVEDMYNYIEQAKVSNIHRIGLTGGEPFLFFERILDISRFCFERSMYLSSLTNAFWASTPDLALKMMRKCKNAGLKHIAVSTSDYHQSFVPLANVKYCVDSAVQCGLSAELRVLVEHNTRSLEDYKNELNLHDGNKIIFEEIPISKVGRGLTLDTMSRGYDNVNNPCSSILRTPVVEPSGNLYMCCGVGYKNEHLCIGNLKKSRLDSLLDKANNNLLYKVISLFGPDTIAKMVKEDFSWKTTEKQYNGICELCNDLLSSDKFAEVSKSINRRKKELILGTKILNSIKSIETSYK